MGDLVATPNKLFEDLVSIDYRAARFRIGRVAPGNNQNVHGIRIQEIGNRIQWLDWAKQYEIRLVID